MATKAPRQPPMATATKIKREVRRYDLQRRRERNVPRPRGFAHPVTDPEKGSVLRSAGRLALLASPSFLELVADPADGDDVLCILSKLFPNRPHVDVNVPFVNKRLPLYFLQQKLAGKDSSWHQ